MCRFRPIQSWGYGLFSETFVHKSVAGFMGPSSFMQNLTLLELFPITLAMELWGELLKNKSLFLDWQFKVGSCHKSFCIPTCYIPSPFFCIKMCRLWPNMFRIWLIQLLMPFLIFSHFFYSWRLSITCGRHPGWSDVFRKLYRAPWSACIA